MKLFISLVCTFAVVLAEPPVGDSYPAARSHDHDHLDVTSRSQARSGTFGSTRNAISEYDTPNARNDISNEYGQPNARTSGLSTEYGPPNIRSGLSTEYGAPNARSSGLSTEYGPPNVRKSSLSTEYGPPNVRSGLSTVYGPPNTRSSAFTSENAPPKTASPRQRYAPPAARVSFSQTYGSSKSQGLGKSLSQAYRATDGRNEPSQEYGTPNTRSRLFQEYETPNTRSRLSQEYGTPNSRSGLASEYGVPSTRSGISEEYGTPAERSLSQEYGVPELTSRSLSTTYGIPEARSTPSEEYGAPAVARSGINSSSKSTFRSSQAQGHTSAQFSPKSLSNDYNLPSTRSNELSPSFAPKSVFGSRSSSKSAYSNPARYLATSYRAPSARNSDSYSQVYNIPSESYGVTAMDLSATYGAPSDRGLSQEYGVPSSRAGSKTKAIASSYSSARSSSSYPSSRGVSDQYGLPEQYDALSNQGYNYAKGALDEADQDPANYNFAYKVNDLESGSDFGHTESRQENHAEGSYFVVLPDGTKQTVEYEADEGGFKPRISMEPSSARNSGYDENASDLARSEGPY